MTLAAFIRLACVTCAAALAGCAAVQIDVDVYKGPLVNEQEIQLRQFAALAIAAKPILASVRDELEVAAGGKATIGNDDFVDSPHLRSDLARFLNGAMLYYWDLGSGAANQLEQGRQRASDNLATFRSYVKGDVALANELTRSTSAEPKDPHRARLAEQYRALLCGGADNLACPDPVLPPSPEKFYRWAREFMVACQEAIPSPTLNCPDSERSNSVYQTLSDKGVLETHALFLFGDVNHDAFVDRMLEIAKSYVALREGMRDVFEGALGLTDELGPGAEPPSKALKESLPQVLAFSVQPRTLACALTTHGADRVRAAWQVLPKAARRKLESTKIASRLDDSRPSAPEFRPGMQANAGARAAGKSATSSPVPDREPDDWSKPAYAASQAAMEAVVRDFPVEFADFLRVVDHEIVALPEADVGQCSALSPYDQSYVKPRASRRYGLASGPSDPGAYNFIDNFPKMDQSSVLIRNSLTAGFDKARLPLGIEHLTRDFLHALDGNEHDADSRPVREARQRLEEALIFFAERMLFVVNTVTRSAIEQDIDAQRTPRIRADITNAAGAPRRDGVHRFSGERADLIARLSSRLAVLQGLGNSLVLQANDLRRQLNHSVRQEARLQGTIDATRLSLNPGAPVVFDALMVQARTQLKQQAEAAARVADAASAATLRSTKAGKDLDDAQAAKTTAEASLAEREKTFKPLQSLVRTYVDANRRKDIYPPNRKTDPAEESDQTRLKAALKEAFPDDNDASSTAYLDKICEWLRLTASGLGKSGVRYERLNAALTYLNDVDTPLRGNPLAAAPRGKLDKAITELLMDWAADQSIQLAALRDNVKTQTAAAVRAQTALARSQAKAKATARGAAEPQAAAPDTASILKVLGERRADVLREAERTGAGDPASLLQLLRASVAALPTQTNETQHAQTFLATFELPSIATYSLPPGWKGKTSTDVYDQLIAQLRQARIQAELAGQTEQSARTLRALNLAYEARAGVAFLRPASDYLKSVYSSTNLQDAADPGQQNLLDAWWRRTLPDAQGQDPYEREARRQAEKLYWQNINHVTLSGGGSTNYVIAKDDIGNWYVKAYSSDPGPIIRSAQSLALFSSGQKLNVNLLNRVNLQRQLAASDDPTERDKLRADLSRTSADGNASLLKVHDRYTTQYALSLTQTAQSLQALNESLVDGIGRSVANAFPTEATRPEAAALAAGLTTSLAEFKDTVAKLDPALKLPATDATRLGKVEDALFNSLDALRRYRRSIYSQMNAAPGICDADPATCVKAASAAQTYVRNQLAPIVAQHRAALASYDNALFNLEDIATSQ